MRNRTLWGLIFIVLGATVFLVQTDALPANVLDLWPVVVIVLGMWLSIDSLGQPAKRRLTGGVVTTAVGAYLLAERLGLLPQGLFFPTVVLALGVGLLLRSGARGE
jgi:hypothetical protein